MLILGAVLGGLLVALAVYGVVELVSAVTTAVRYRELPPRAGGKPR